MFCHFFVLFLSFGPCMMYFHVCPANHLNPPKLWKLLATNSYLYCFW
jgi:hypothetical protein